MRNVLGLVGVVCAAAATMNAQGHPLVYSTSFAMTNALGVETERQYEAAAQNIMSGSALTLALGRLTDVASGIAGTAVPASVQGTRCIASPNTNTYRSSTLEFQFPRNWNMEDLKSMLAFGPSDGNGECVLLVGFNSDMRGEVVGATAALLRRTLAMYPDARSEGPPSSITIGQNYPAASTTWVRTLEGREMRNQIVGVATSGGLLFFQCNFRTNAAASAVPVFERILASMRIEDVLPSSLTAVPVTPPEPVKEELAPRAKEMSDMLMSVIRNAGNLDGAWTGQYTALIGLSSTPDVKDWNGGSITSGVQYGRTAKLNYGLQFSSSSGRYRFTIDKDGELWMNQVGAYTVNGGQLALTPTNTERRPGDWVDVAMPDGFDGLHQKPVYLRFQITCDASRLRINFASRPEHTFAKTERLLHAYRQGDGGGCR